MVQISTVHRHLCTGFCALFASVLIQNPEEVVATPTPWKAELRSMGPLDGHMAIDLGIEYFALSNFTKRS